MLGDLGAPSRVRGDEAAHLEPLGGGPDDLGSRFERIAALAYGRLGVPAPSTVITRTKLREFFAAADAAPSRLRSLHRRSSAMQHDKSGRAIVIGGSMAGLLAARVLANHFKSVTIIERDAHAASPEFRRGV